MQKKVSYSFDTQLGRYIVYMERQPRQRRMRIFFFAFYFLKICQFNRLQWLCSIGRKMGRFYSNADGRVVSYIHRNVFAINVTKESSFLHLVLFQVYKRGTDVDMVT